jgi:hypothetical protein
MPFVLELKTESVKKIKIDGLRLFVVLNTPISPPTTPDGEDFWTDLGELPKEAAFHFIRELRTGLEASGLESEDVLERSKPLGEV